MSDEYTIDTLQIEFTTNAEDVSSGIDKLRDTLSKLSGIEKKASGASDKSNKSFNNIKKAVSKATSVCSAFFKKANEYVETLNLFEVAMGSAAKSAKKYADIVESVMGIDVQEWMNYQGAFQQIIEGFGMASDTAEVMSRNLTQIAYDLSSLWNVDVESAFNKLQSGMSGQIKGLKTWGINLSMAQLKETALAHGIELSTAKMTEAQKSTLRYITIMEKTVNIQGDLARTIVTPANAIRILNTQFERAKRAIGQIISIFAVKLIPVVQAVVRVVTEAAEALAKFLGYKLPEIDYSGIDVGASAAEDISDNLGEAVSNAKELKKTILGIDEINKLEDNSSANGSIELGGGYAPDFGIDLSKYDYDFLDGVSKESEKYYKMLKKVLNPLKKIWDILCDYKELVLAAVGLAAVTKLWNKLRGFGDFLSNKMGVSSWFSAFVSGFKDIRTGGGNIFQALKGGLDNVRNSLNGIQKAAIVAVAGVLEFGVVKGAVKDLYLGCDNTAAKIIEIGVAAGGAAIAMYAALGPAGLAIAGCVALVGAIAGIAEANDEMMTAVNNEIFYSGVGTKISTVAQAYGDWCQKIVETNQPILDNQKRIDELQGSIDTTKTSIDSIATAITSGKATAEEKLPELKGLFETLETDTEQVLLNIHGNIVKAIGGSFGDALFEAGESIPKVMEVLNKIKGEGVDTLSKLQSELDTLTADLESGKMTQEEFGEKWFEIEKKMDSLVGTTSEYTDVFSDLKDKLSSGIDWENEDAKNDFFSSITESTDSAKTSIIEASDSIIENLNIMKNWTTDDSLKDKIDSWIKIEEGDKQKQLSEVDSQLTDLFDLIQTDIINKTADVQKNAEEAWDNMDPVKKFFLEKLWDENKESYVQGALNNWQKNIATPISDDINESLKSLGIDGSAWASDAMTSIVDKLFSTEFLHSDYNGTHSVNSYKTDLETAISKTFSELETSGKKKSGYTGEQIDNGLVSGISKNKSFVAAAIESTIKAAHEAGNKAADIHSPSKLFATQGRYIIEGLANGIINTSPVIFRGISSVITNALSRDTAWSYGRSFGEELVRGIADGFKNMSLPKLKGDFEIDGEGSAILKLQAYAAGGFPDAGQMFIAREAGPEMVGTIGGRTAVANNDQIIDGIAEGVAEAEAEQNALLREQNELLRRLLEKDNGGGNYPDTSNIISILQRKNRRDGKTVVPVGI